MRCDQMSTRARWEHRGCEAHHETKRSTLEAMVNGKRATPSANRQSPRAGLRAGRFAPPRAHKLSRRSRMWTKPRHSRKCCPRHLTPFTCGAWSREL